MDHDDDSWPLHELFSQKQWQVIGRRLRLSRRQLEISRLMCRGLQRKQIARTLKVSAATVRTHMEKLFQRLGIRDRIGVPVRMVLAHRRRMARGAAKP